MLLSDPVGVDSLFIVPLSSGKLRIVHEHFVVTEDNFMLLISLGATNSDLHACECFRNFISDDLSCA